MPEGAKPHPRARRGALRRSLAFMRSHWPQTTLSVFFLLLSSAGNLAVPTITKEVIDNGIVPSQAAAILAGCLMIVGITALRSLFTFLQGVLAARVSQQVAFEMRNALYDKIQRLSFSYHDQAQTGQLLTRATSDVDQVRNFISMGVIQILSTVLVLTGSLYLLLGINWRLTLHVLPIMALVAVIFLYISRVGRPMFRVVQEKVAALNTQLEENIVGVRMVKAYRGEPAERRRFEEANDDLMQFSRKVARLFAFAMPLVFAMSNFGTLVVTWGGGVQILAERLTIGELVAFQGYLFLVMFPITTLGWVMMSISQAAASAERIFEILDARSEVVEKPTATTLAPMRNGLAFEDVEFRYVGSAAPVINAISLRTSAEESIAIVGETGSGKSTIVNLIPRFYDVTRGRIAIDDVDVRDVTLESLRRQIGIVLEETTLFGGTIRQNIAYGRPEASDQQVHAVAEAAAAAEFISELPEGYDSTIGERGVTLSGGQKQRLAIARALLIEPRILILDDSTSSVDFETEAKIRAAIERLRIGRLSFVIASRLSTVQNADRVMVMEGGRLAAMGSHSSLLHESALYAEIYYSQLQPEAAA